MRRGFIAGIAVVIVAAAVAVYFYSSRNTPDMIASKQTVTDQATLPQVSPTPADQSPPDSAQPAEEVGNELSGMAPPSDFDETTVTRSWEPRPVKVYGTVLDAANGNPVSGALLFTDTYQSLLESVDDPDFDEDNIDLTAAMTPEKLREALESGESLPREFQESLDAPTTVTDESGAYSITVDSEMTAMVFCRAKGYATESRETNAVTPESMRVDFQLRKGASVSGRVTDLATGEPVADVVVAAVSDRNKEDMGYIVMRFGSMDKTATEADGTYTLGGLSDGVNQIVVRDTKHGWLFDGSRIVNLTLKEGEERAGIDLVVSKGLTVHGTIKNEKGEPVEGAKVTTKPSISTSSYDPYTFRMKTPVAFSDASGNYTAVGLRQGASEIRVSHDDYAGAAAMAELPEGKTSHVVDFTLVTGVSVSGTAKRKDGKPAEMVSLYLSKEPNKEKQDRFAFVSGNFMDSLDNSSFTDSETGEFTFEHVPAGKYILSTGPVGLFDDDMGMELPRVPVEVDGKNDVRNLEIIVPTGENSFRVAEGKITGIVLDQEGQPAANVGVRAVHTDADEFDFSGGFGPDTATEKDGTFELDLYDKEDTQTVYAESDLGEASQENVKNGDNITLRLGPLTSVSGEVVDAAGNAVARCKVILAEAKSDEPETMMSMMSRMMQDAMGSMGPSETTDDFGQFSFKHARPGSYVIEATSTGSGFGASEPFSVSKGAEKSGIRIVLEAGALFAGIVVDGAGNPVQGANVSLKQSTGNMMDSYMSAMADFRGADGFDAVATSGADGTFTMEGLKPGRFTVSAKHAEYAPYIENNVEVAANQGSPYRVTLGNGGGAHGQFLVDGKPKANVAIQLSGPAGMKMVTTDSEGRFEVKGLAVGTYMVIPMDFDPTNMNADAEPDFNFKSVAITEGGDALITFGTGVSVTGTVPTERLGKNAYVYIVRKGAPDVVSQMNFGDPMAAMETGMQMMQYMVGMAEVNEDGTFSVKNIDPGEYELHVYSMDFDMEDMGSEDFLNMSVEEIQAQSDRFAPKEVFKQPVTVGDAALTVEFEKQEAETAP